MAASDSSFPDTREGLRQFLGECILSAKSNDKKKLDSELRGTEIPDYANWLPATWPGPGPSWVEPYGRDLSKNEAQFRRLLVYLARQEGELIIRKVNDEPQGGKGMEWGMLQSMARPVDIFYASWKREPGPPVDERDLPIGYFFYVNGGFRWDSMTHFSSTSLVHRVDPVYPYEVDGKHPAGTVILRFTVARDGTVKAGTIQAMPGPKFATDPKLIKAASDALKQWIYRPPSLYGNSEETVSFARIVVAPSAPANP
jgi:hypothetical protein